MTGAVVSDRRQAATHHGAPRRHPRDRRLRRQRRAPQRICETAARRCRGICRRAGRRHADRARGGRGRRGRSRSPVFWTPVSRTAWLKGGRGAYPHLALDRSKPGLIAVNAAGRRFVDEAVSYHDFVLGMHRSHETVPTIPAWLVCDARFLHKYGLGRIPPGRRELRLGGQERLSRRGANRRGAGQGDRRRCGGPPRGDRAQQPLRQDRRGQRLRQGLDRVRPQQRRSEARPQSLHRTDRDTALLRDGGLSEHARQQHRAQGRRRRPCARCARQRRFAGLFACGNDMASIMRGTYPGPGITLGPALVFAWRAAMAVAGKSS